MDISTIPVRRWRSQRLATFERLRAESWRKPNEYCWHGPVKHEERDSQGRMIYRISEMAVKFI